METLSRTILLVDDDSLVRGTYEFAFKAAGYEVVLADEGSKVLALLEQQTIATVILDVFMPGQDGIETLLTIKRKFPSVKVIVMSGGGQRGQYDFLAAAMKLGADGIVRKPILPQKLISMLENNTIPRTA